VRWIAVDGKVLGGNPATGHLRLTINIPHDAIANAVPLVAGTSQTSTNAGATHEYGEPKHCGDTYATKSVWYRSTASSSSTVTVGATGSNVLCVAVYQAAAAPSSVSSLAAIAAASDDQGDPAEVTFAAPADAHLPRRRGRRLVRDGVQPDDSTVQLRDDLDHLHDHPAGLIPSAARRRGPRPDGTSRDQRATSDFAVRR
jgi:hypothetical protein